MFRSGNKVLNTHGVCHLDYLKCRDCYGFSVRQLCHVVSTSRFTFVWTCLSITFINSIMYRHLSSVLRHIYVNTCITLHRKVSTVSEDLIIIGS